MRKLSKKLLLVAATEAIDVQEPEPIVVSKKDKKGKKEETPKKVKKLLIIESDESDE